MELLAHLLQRSACTIDETEALFQHLATGYLRNEHSGQSAMNLPVWPFRLVFLIAFTLFALQILAEIVKTVRGFNAAAARGDTA